MWGADDAIYFVADPLPNDKSVKPGSPEVRKSVNNIYKIPARRRPAGAGHAATPTAALFWPSMSSDGKVIVYEENFGIWKLDVASGKSNEIKLDIASDEKDNEVEVETVSNEVDAFDISPSGRRAVISARGQILTIATERGDITRVAPDEMASRNQLPKWSPDGKYIAFISDRSGRDEIWITDPEGAAPKKITDLDNEKGALVWTPDSKALLYTAADKKLYSYTVADGRRRWSRRATSARIGSVAVSPDSKWVAFSKQDRTLRSHVYIAPIGGGEERHISDDSTLYAENNAVWTADGRYLVFTSAEGFSNGIATQGGINTTMELWALSLRDQDRDPRTATSTTRRRASRPKRRRGRHAAAAAPAARQPVEVRIDWSGLARRARQLTVPGTTIGGLTPAPEGHSVALTVVDRRRRRRTRRRRRRAAGGHVHHQRRERPAHARAAGAAAGRRRRRAAAADAAARRRLRRRRHHGRSRATAARCTSAPAPASTRAGRCRRTRRRRRRRRRAAAARRTRRRGGAPAAGAGRRRTRPRGR